MQLKELTLFQLSEEVIEVKFTTKACLKFFYCREIFFGQISFFSSILAEPTTTATTTTTTTLIWELSRIFANFFVIFGPKVKLNCTLPHASLLAACLTSNTILKLLKITNSYILSWIVLYILWKKWSEIKTT